jgi:hypothetical protein
MREGDTIPGFAPLQVGGFASGCFATVHTGASTGEAAFSITMKNGSTDTAVGFGFPFGYRFSFGFKIDLRLTGILAGATAKTLGSFGVVTSDDDSHFRIAH